jgi:hypothetical protein
MARINLRIAPLVLIQSVQTLTAFGTVGLQEYSANVMLGLPVTAPPSTTSAFAVDGGATRANCGLIGVTENLGQFDSLLVRRFSTPKVGFIRAATDGTPQ